APLQKALGILREPQHERILEQFKLDPLLPSRGFKLCALAPLRELFRKKCAASPAATSREYPAPAAAPGPSRKKSKVICVLESTRSCCASSENVEQARERAGSWIVGGSVTRIYLRPGARVARR